MGAHCEKYAALAGKFLKRQYSLHLLAALAFCLLSGGIVSFRNLNEGQCARVMEQYVSLLGSLLMTPLFMPEQDREIWYLERTKAMSMWKLYLLRLLIGLLVLALILTAYLGLLRAEGSVFQAERLWLGSFAEAVFLGSIGFCVCACTNQVVIGYMVSIIYYMCNYGAGKYFGPFELFTMTRGEYDFWPCMLGGALFLIVLGILVRERKR